MIRKEKICLELFLVTSSVNLRNGMEWEPLEISLIGTNKSERWGFFSFFHFNFTELPAMLQRRHHIH